MGSSPLWISHRGYKESAVENTRHAFEAALALGFTALETDLRLSADGHLVLHHDPDLRRLAGRGESIATLTRAELEAVDLGGGARLLFFDEFAEAFAGASWTLDIKKETGAQTLEALGRWVEEHKAADWLAANARFVLWDRTHETRLRELFPASPTYALERECWRAGLCVYYGLPALAGITPGRTYALPPRVKHMRFYRPEIIQRFHERGARVIAFLPETPREHEDALRAGVDEILTNGPILSIVPA